MSFLGKRKRGFSFALAPPPTQRSGNMVFRRRTRRRRPTRRPRRRTTRRRMNRNSPHELKRLDTQVGEAGIPQTANALTPTLLTDVDQGLLSSNRIGIKINAKSFYCRLAIKNAIPANAVDQVIRVIVVKFLEFGLGAELTLGTVLADGGEILSFRDTRSTQAIKILKDIRFPLYATQRLERIVNIFLPLNHVITYNTFEGTSTTYGSLYLFVLTDQAAGTGTPTVMMINRFRFTG